MESITDLLSKFKFSLRIYRVSLGFDQSQVAKALSISLRKYQRIESGEALPSIEESLILSQLFNTSLEELIKCNTSEQLKFIKNDDELRIKYPNFFEIIELINSHQLSTNNGSCLFNVIKNEDKFINSEFKMTISNWSHSIYNKSFGKQVKLSYGVLHNIGLSLKNPLKIISYIQEVYGNTPCITNAKDSVKHGPDLEFYTYSNHLGDGVFFSLVLMV